MMMTKKRFKPTISYDEWKARAEAAEAELSNLRDELSDSVNALNRLWRDIILPRNPDYGDWEYPGQAYRHIKAEFEDAEAEIDVMQQDLDALRAREADLLHTLHMEQDAHDRCRAQLAARCSKRVRYEEDRIVDGRAADMLAAEVPEDDHADDEIWQQADAAYQRLTTLLTEKGE